MKGGDGDRNKLESQDSEEPGLSQDYKSIARHIALEKELPPAARYGSVIQSEVLLSPQSE